MNRFIWLPQLMVWFDYDQDIYLMDCGYPRPERKWLPVAPMILTWSI